MFGIVCILGTVHKAILEVINCHILKCSKHFYMNKVCELQPDLCQNLKVGLQYVKSKNNRFKYFVCCCILFLF